MSQYNMEDDGLDVPFDVTESFDMDDLGDQQGGVMDAYRKVPFVIRKAKVRIQDSVSEVTGDKVWGAKRLSLEVAISPLGVDGEGKYKGKVLFADLMLSFNQEDFPKRQESEWWQKKARYDTKEFFTALGIPLKGTKVNDEFLASLQGREFLADITKKERETKKDGAYVKTGEFENELKNFKRSLVDAD